jgi:hypothetical protein
MVIHFHVAECDVVDDRAQLLWLSFEPFTEFVKLTFDFFIFNYEGCIIWSISLFEFESLCDLLLLTIILFIISLLTLIFGFIMILRLRFIKRYDLLFNTLII